MSEDVYTSPSELKNIAEQVDEIETDDYVDYQLIPVGTYVSQSRQVKVTQKSKNVDGVMKRFISAEVSFPNGIQNEETGQALGGGQYPLRTWVTTLRFPAREGQTGETSGVAEYLKRVGFDPKQLKSVEDILDALEESQALPVKVYVGWTNKTEKLDDGSYTKEFAKTKDFNIGTKEEPSYQPFFVKDGTKVLAKHKIAGFKRA
jgi:hypothetical protein